MVREGAVFVTEYLTNSYWVCLSIDLSKFAYYSYFLLKAYYASFARIYE